MTPSSGHRRRVRRVAVLLAGLAYAGIFGLAEWPLRHRPLAGRCVWLVFLVLTIWLAVRYAVRLVRWVEGPDKAAAS